MKRVVRKIRDEICEEYLGGNPLTGKIEELREICRRKSLAKAFWLEPATYLTLSYLFLFEFGVADATVSQLLS